MGLGLGSSSFIFMALFWGAVVVTAIWVLGKLFPGTSQRVPSESKHDDASGLEELDNDVLGK